MNIHTAKAKTSLLHLTEKAFQKLIKAKQVQNITDYRKACLIWAHSVVCAGKALGPPFNQLQLQGGSASWRVVLPEKDDGVSPTHYSYTWFEEDSSIDGANAVIQALDMHSFPEVHFWAGMAPEHDPLGKGLIVDMTTRFVTSLAMEAGIKCSCAPPNTVYAPPDDMPLNCSVYRPFKSAIKMGMNALRQVYPHHFGG